MRQSQTRPQGTRKQQGTTRKAQHKTLTSRARKGEYLLLTGTSLISTSALECLAETLFGMMLVDTEGRYQQVVSIRIDAGACKVYGRCQEMYEAAPYMFAPVPKEQHSKRSSTN